MSANNYQGPSARRGVPDHIASTEEVNALANMFTALELRVDAMPNQDQIASQVEIAIKSQTGLLSEEERIWVKLAIKREAQSIQLRQALIEKSLTGLLWSAIVGLGLVLSEYFKNHGWKP